MRRTKIILGMVILAIFINCNTVHAENINEKVVFLTFDDGPSANNTEEIIRILNENNVRATFFVVGENVKSNPKVVTKLKNSNMAIYPHCNNHKYTELYSSEENYFNDLESCNKIIESTTGKTNSKLFVRLPGGSDNLVCNQGTLQTIKMDLIKNNYYYVDWNVDIGDANAIQVSTDTLLNNINKYSGTYEVEVVLMHDLDCKKSTIDALERVINEYKSMGYKFKTFDDISRDEINYLQKIKVINR